MGKTTDPIFVEFEATAVPAPPGMRGTRTIVEPPKYGGEPVWYEFETTAEPAPPNAHPTRSLGRFGGTAVLPLELFLGLHPDCQQVVVERLHTLDDNPDRIIPIERGST